MKILIISRNYPHRNNLSVFAFVHTRAKMYLQRGNKVKVFIPSRQGVSQYTYTYDNIEVMQAPLTHVSRIISSFDPDGLVIHSPWAQLLSYISKFGRPIITYIHGSEAQISALLDFYTPLSVEVRLGSCNFLKIVLDRGRLWYNDFTRCLELGKSLNKSTAIVYPSKWVRDICQRHTRVRHPQSFVIPNPVDTELFKSPTRHSLSERRGALSVRSLEWVYGLDIAIKAFSNLEEAKLTILGKGSLEDYLRKLSQQYNSNVRFIVRMIDHDKMPHFMDEFGFFIAPSRIESQGLAMCEAMACGMPVIATRVGGIPEFLKDGFNGLLVPPEDPISIRQAVKLLTSNPVLYEKLSQNASFFVRENLSFEKIYQQDCQVFELARHML